VKGWKYGGAPAFAVCKTIYGGDVKIISYIIDIQCDKFAQKFGC
jgi:hypothetical protein